MAWSDDKDEDSDGSSWRRLALPAGAGLLVVVLLAGGVVWMLSGDTGTAAQGQRAHRHHDRAATASTAAAPSAAGAAARAEGGRADAGEAGDHRGEGGRHSKGCATRTPATMPPPGPPRPRRRRQGTGRVVSAGRAVEAYRRRGRWWRRWQPLGLVRQHRAGADRSGAALQRKDAPRGDADSGPAVVGLDRA